MRNVEKLRNYFLGKDPQLKETMADNSLRLIGIEGKHFVLRTELLTRLKKLKDELTEVDEDLQRQIDGVVADLEAEAEARALKDTQLENDIGAERTARQNADNDLSRDIANEATARANKDRELENSLDIETQSRIGGDNALWDNFGNYYSKAQTDGLLNNKQDVLTAGDNITINNNVISANIDIDVVNLSYNDSGSAMDDYIGELFWLAYAGHDVPTYYHGLAYIEGWAPDGKLIHCIQQHFDGDKGYAERMDIVYNNSTNEWEIQPLATLYTTTSADGIDSQSGDEEYPTSKAVYDFVSQAGGIPKFELRFDDPLNKFDNYIGKLVYITHFTSRPGSLYQAGTDEFNDIYYVTTKNQKTELLSLRCITYNGATASNMFRQDTYQPDTTVWEYAVHKIDSTSQTISSSSTNNQLSTAKAVYDFVMANSGDIIDVDSDITLDNNTEPGIYYNNGNAQVHILSGYDSSIILSIDPQNFFMIEKHINDIAVTSWGVIGDIHRKTYNLVNHQVDSAQKSFSLIEQTSNKVTSLSSGSTDVQYPSAKCVYDYVQAEVGNIASALQNINTGNGV